MEYTKPQQSPANPSRPGPTVDDSDAARQRLQTAFGKAIGLLEELGAIDDIAVMYQENPLSAELGFRDDLLGMGRNMLGKAFKAFTDQGSTLEVEGKKYRKVAPSNGQAITVIGSVGFSRPRCRPTSGQGESFIPTQRLPLTFELASLATTLGVRHGLVILDAQQYHSGGCLVGGTSVKGGMLFERVLICYGPVGNISASSGLLILLDMAR